MNKWMNEQMNEWTNEWMNKWMNEQMNEWTNEWMNKWMDQMKKWNGSSGGRERYGQRTTATRVESGVGPLSVQCAAVLKNRRCTLRDCVYKHGHHCHVLLVRYHQYSSRRVKGDMEILFIRQSRKWNDGWLTPFARQPLLWSRCCFLRSSLFHARRQKKSAIGLSDCPSSPSSHAYLSPTGGNTSGEVWKNCNDYRQSVYLLPASQCHIMTPSGYVIFISSSSSFPIVLIHKKWEKNMEPVPT